MPRTRPAGALRPISIETPFLESVESSVLYSSGRTKVLCVATLESGVPRFLEGSGRGWATAEYSLLPASTLPRGDRERGGRLSGRTQEIQRLIGRSLRGVLDLSRLDGWTLRLDCDVLQADGGTRTASISGAFVAAQIAIRAAVADGRLAADCFANPVAAVSVGVVGDTPLLDLDYEEDSSAEVDMNVVMDGDGRFLEVQGSAEGKPFDRAALNELLDLAAAGIDQIFARQREALGA